MGKAARIKRERAAAAAAGRVTPTPLDEVRNRIAVIRDTNLRTASIDELIDLLTPLYMGWTVRAPVFPSGSSIFRGRKLDERPKRLSDVGHPPPETTPQGRANRPGSPVFYGTSTREPIYFELGVGVGDRLAIVHHKTTADLLVNRIGYTTATFDRLQSRREVPDYGNLDLSAYTRRDALIDDFLSEVFCERHAGDEDWRYNLSVAIAEKMMPQVEQQPDDGPRIASIQGLIYPTVPMWGNADNLALKTSFVETSLTPIYAEYVEVTEVHDVSLGINGLDEARSFEADGAINWLGHPAQWTLSGGRGGYRRSCRGPLGRAQPRRQDRRARLRHASDFAGASRAT